MLKPNIKIRTCMRVTQTGMRCKNCIINKESKTCHWHADDRSNHVAEHESMVYMDPETCFLSKPDGSDAEYERTRCSQKLQRQCLVEKNMSSPKHNTITIAQKTAAQSATTEKIASIKEYSEVSGTLLGLLSRFVSTHLRRVSLFVKGSSPLRDQVNDIIQHSLLDISSDLKTIVEKSLKSSDIDTLVLIDPKTSGFTDYVASVTEMIAGRLLEIVNTTFVGNTAVNKLIQEVNGVTLLDGIINHGFMFREPFHAGADQGDDETHNTLYVRRLGNENEDISNIKTLKSWPRKYTANKRNSKTNPTKDVQLYEVNCERILASISDTFSFSKHPTKLYTPSVIDKSDGTSIIRFGGLDSVHEKGIVILNNVVVPCEYRETPNHAGYVTANFDVSEMPKKMRQIKSDLYGKGRQIGNTNVVEFTDHYILYRGSLEIRRKAYLNDTSGITVYSVHVEIPHNSAAFMLIRAVIPFKIQKGESVKWSKAEILDIAIPLQDDISLDEMWSKFNPTKKDQWATYWQYGSYTVPTVSLEYQIYDLVRMLRITKNAGMDDMKTGKRKMRKNLLCSLRNALELRDEKDENGRVYDGKNKVMLRLIRQRMGARRFHKAMFILKAAGFSIMYLKPSSLPMHLFGAIGKAIPESFVSLIEIFRLFNR